MKNSNAFTMMEMLVVLFIIGLLATFGGPRIMKFFGRAQVTGTKAIMTQVSQAVLQYNMDMGHYPRREEGGLSALVTPPSRQELAAKWNGPYIEDDKLYDKWDNEFMYNSPPERHKGKYRYFEILSYGADGQEGGTGENAELHVGG